MQRFYLLGCPHGAVIARATYAGHEHGRSMALGFRCIYLPHREEIPRGVMVRQDSQYNIDPEKPNELDDFTAAMLKQEGKALSDLETEIVEAPFVQVGPCSDERRSATMLRRLNITPLLCQWYCYSRWCTRPWLGEKGGGPCRRRTRAIV